MFYYVKISFACRNDVIYNTVLLFQRMEAKRASDSHRDQSLFSSDCLIQSTFPPHQYCRSNEQNASEDREEPCAWAAGGG